MPPRGRPRAVAGNVRVLALRVAGVAPEGPAAPKGYGFAVAFVTEILLAAAGIKL